MPTIAAILIVFGGTLLPVIALALLPIMSIYLVWQIIKRRGKLYKIIYICPLTDRKRVIESIPKSVADVVKQELLDNHNAQAYDVHVIKQNERVEK